MNIVSHNREAWNSNVDSDNEWTRPVTPEAVANARAGNWDIILTPTKPVPKSWFPPLSGLKVLCLASGGGQQGPILAAAGADVTVFDNSDRQLAQDRFVAERDGLAIRTVQGDMANLEAFGDGSFDFIVHPVSNVFVEHLAPVWREAHRVLRDGGAIIAGFMNPLVYLFDIEAEERGELEVKHSIPYSDLKHLPKHLLEEYVRSRRPLEFGHRLEDQIAGQLDAGFVITGFYEDSFGGKSLLDKHIDIFIATKAVKAKL